MNDVTNRLAEYFLKFPGIGKRQASRFVYFLLNQEPKFLENLTKALTNLKQEIVICKECQRFFVGRETQTGTCSTCSDTGRDSETLMIVEKDIDLENIEDSGVYKGYYFVLGGTLPVLTKTEKGSLRSTELSARVKSIKPKEIILAMSVNPEGENTAKFVRGELEKIAGNPGFTISVLGRGLSTGTELEYSDSETIKNALENRG